MPESATGAMNAAIGLATRELGPTASGLLGGLKPELRGEATVYLDAAPRAELVSPPGLIRISTFDSFFSFSK